MAMARVRELPGGSDLLAGATAAGLLLILVFGLHLDFWLGLVLALVTYLGLRLALPSRKPGVPELSEAEALKRAHQRVTDLKTLARQRYAARVGDRGDEPIGRIAEQAGRVLAAIEEEPGRRRLAAWYLREYLTPIHGVVSRYARLRERGVAAAAPSLTTAETETLPMIERILGELHDRLYQEDVVDLKVQSEMLELRDELPPTGAP
jgi:hypothetical protein